MFKEQLKTDLEKVFFNDKEFACEAMIAGKPPVIVIYDEEYEVIEGDEVVAVAPALIVNKDLAKTIKDDDGVLVENESYFVADKIPENDICIILLKR